MNPHLLAVDWGSTSLRGALLDAEGRVLDERRAVRGLLSVPVGSWSAVFDENFGDWMARWPTLRCLMAGMVGSRQGWAEVPYVACPATLAELAQRLHWVRPGRVAIVPGLCVDAAGVPDVMRGEETQVFGSLELLGWRDACLVLPGTHSKWVQVQDGRVTRFNTHMTGECYALLRHQSLLSRSLPAQEAAWHEGAFDDGVACAQRAGGLLHHLFGVRAMDLFQRRPDAELESYLSGLLIGEELRAEVALRGAGASSFTAVAVIGSDALTTRYQRALASLGVAAQVLGADATWRGLMALAAHTATIRE